MDAKKEKYVTTSNTQNQLVGPQRARSQAAGNVPIHKVYVLSPTEGYYDTRAWKIG